MPVLAIAIANSALAIGALLWIAIDPARFDRVFNNVRNGRTNQEERNAL